MWFVYAVVAASAVLSLVQLKIRKRQDFRGKHVFITGGSEGIGLGLAREFLQRGCRVTLVARTRSKLESARARLVEEDASAANRVGIAAADVTEESQVMEAVRSATQAYGPIDVLMCNAGIVEPGYFLDLGTDQFDSVMRVNYGGTLRTIKAVLPGMLARRSGYISLTCSPLSAIGMTGYSAYSPSKAAIRSLADSLRVELTSTGVGISVSYPPDTSTPGFVREHQLMVPETASYYKLIGNSVFPCQQVCACMVKGMEAGKYHLPAPDVLQNLLLTCTCGPTPRSFLLPVEMLLGLLAPLIAAPMIWLQERCVVWHGQERLQRQAQLASE